MPKPVFCRKTNVMTSGLSFSQRSCQLEWPYDLNLPVLVIIYFSLVNIRHHVILFIIVLTYILSYGWAPLAQENLTIVIIILGDSECFVTSRREVIQKVTIKSFTKFAVRYIPLLMAQTLSAFQLSYKKKKMEHLDWGRVVLGNNWGMDGWSQKWGSSSMENASLRYTSSCLMFMVVLLNWYCTGTGCRRLWKRYWCDGDPYLTPSFQVLQNSLKPSQRTRNRHGCQCLAVRRTGYIPNTSNSTSKLAYVDFLSGVERIIVGIHNQVGWPWWDRRVNNLNAKWLMLRVIRSGDEEACHGVFEINHGRADRIPNAIDPALGLGKKLIVFYRGIFYR